MSENIRIELDMGLSEKDFGDVLGNAVKPYAVEATSQGYLLRHEQQSISIQKTVLPPRAIASIRLPRMTVVLEFDGHDESQVEQFMQRFNRYMHRGGG